MYPGHVPDGKWEGLLKKLRCQPGWLQFYFVGALVAALMSAAIFVSKLSDSALLADVIRWLMSAFGVLFAIGFIIWCWPSLQSFWQRGIGKVAVLLVNGFALLFATGQARALVSSSLQLPPQDFELTVAFFTPLYLFMFFYELATAGLLLVGFFFLLRWIYKAWQSAKSFHARELGHALGAIAAGVVASILVAPATRFIFDAEFVRRIAYGADFHEAANYPGVLPKERVRLHENGIVSSAVLVSGKVIITTEKRNF